MKYMLAILISSAVIGTSLFGQDGTPGETRTPMGLVIVGGTVVTTVMTLFVVPCLYRVLDYFERESKHGELKL